MTPRLALRRAWLPAVAVLVAFAALAGDASAKVTWKGIGGVRLGMTESQVRSKLGTPSAVSEAEAPGSHRHRYRRHKLDVVVHDGRVAALHTTSRSERAPRGVRVGMAQRRMRRLVRGESCSTAQGLRVCSLDRGQTVMEFVCRKRRVVRIGISRIS